MESAVGIHFRRGKQWVSRLLSRRNPSVYSSVWTSRNPDFDLGVDFVDTLKYNAVHCILDLKNFLVIIIFIIHIFLFYIILYFKVNLYNKKGTDKTLLFFRSVFSAVYFVISNSCIPMYPGAISYLSKTTTAFPLSFI